MPNEPRNLLRANLTVKYANPPKTGKKMGSVKDEYGGYWFIWPNELARIQQGQVIGVEYTEADPDEQGRRAKFIQKVTSVDGAQPTPPPPPTAGQAAPQFDERNPPPPGNPNAPVPGPVNRPSDDPTPERIFVTGVVQRMMGTGKYEITDIDMLTKAAKEAYRNNLA